MRHNVGKSECHTSHYNFPIVQCVLYFCKSGEAKRSLRREPIYSTSVSFSWQNNAKNCRLSFCLNYFSSTGIFLLQKLELRIEKNLDGGCFERKEDWVCSWGLRVGRELLIHISTRNEKSEEANGGESLLPPSYYLTKIKEKIVDKILMRVQMTCKIWRYVIL